MCIHVCVYIYIYTHRLHPKDGCQIESGRVGKRIHLRFVPWYPMLKMCLNQAGCENCSHRANTLSSSWSMTVLVPKKKEAAMGRSLL